MAAEILVVGLSHRTAPIEIREKLAVAGDGLGDELRSILASAPFSEALVVSTCNRVEIYGVAPDAGAAARATRAYLAQRAAPVAVEAMLYERTGADAVRHAFRVASSLDSMVLGEPQVLGQVKHAFETASSSGSIGALLGRCFNRAFTVAKRVRTETGVAAGAVSVSSIACELARKIFGNLRGRHVLLVGAGKMSERAAKSLHKNGASLFVTNRSQERAEELARACGGEARPIEELASELARADVVITSTSSPRAVITYELMHGVARARRHRPLFLIDIAVPRDVEARVGTLDNVFLYDVDDLQKVSDENLAIRRREADNAERIVESEVVLFEQWRRSLELTPTIVALRERFRDVVHRELERTVPRLKSLSEDDRRTLDAMCEAMVNKLLHPPLVALKRGADEAEGPALIAAAQRLFDLAGVEPGPQPAAATAQTETKQSRAEAAALAHAGARVRPRAEGE